MSLQFSETTPWACVVVSVNPLPEGEVGIHILPYYFSSEDEATCYAMHWGGSMFMNGVAIFVHTVNLIHTSSYGLLKCQKGIRGKMEMSIFDERF